MKPTSQPRRSARPFGRASKLVLITILVNVLVWGLAFIPAVQNLPYWLLTGKTYEELEALTEQGVGIPPLPQELE